jgi:hypothetical protein
LVSIFSGGRRIAGRQIDIGTGKRLRSGEKYREAGGAASGAVAVVHEHERCAEWSKAQIANVVGGF